MEQLGQIIEFPSGATWGTYGPNHGSVRGLMEKLPTLTDVDMTLIQSRFAKLDQNLVEIALESAEVMAGIRGRSKPLELARGAATLTVRRICKQAGANRIENACRAMAVACVLSDVLFQPDLRILKTAFLGIYPAMVTELRAAS